MNNSEKQIKQQLKSEGWKVLRGGAPDFIALKVNDTGQITEFKGVEVKSRNGKLSYEQSIYKKIFEMAGIPYEVIISVQSSPDRSRPNQTIPVQTVPIQASPVQSTPFQPAPSHTTPDQSSPYQSNPF